MLLIIAVFLVNVLLSPILEKKNDGKMTENTNINFNPQILQAGKLILTKENVQPIFFHLLYIAIRKYTEWSNHCQEPSHLNTFIFDFSSDDATYLKIIDTALNKNALVI